MVAGKHDAYTKDKPTLILAAAFSENETLI